MSDPVPANRNLIVDQTFNEAASGYPAKGLSISGKQKRISPISVRFSEKERALLVQYAGRQSLSAYVREKVLGDHTEQRRKTQASSVDQALFAKGLALLGQSRLSQNVNQIAKGLNSGTLAVTPDVVAEVQQACSDVRLIRQALLTALGRRG